MNTAEIPASAAEPAPAASQAAPATNEAPTGSPGTVPEVLQPATQAAADAVSAAEIATKPGDPAKPAADPARPDWLLPKYKTVEDQAKAYVEAQKLLGKKPDAATADPASVVPEEYELKVPEGFDGEAFPDEDIAFYREHGFSNKQAQAVADLLYTQIAPAMQEMRAEAEVSSLKTSWKVDDNAYASRMTSLKQWGEANLPPAAMAAMSGSAAGIQAMWGMYQSGAKGIITANSAPAVMSRAQLSDRVSDPRYKSDEGFRQETERMYAQVFDAR